MTDQQPHTPTTEDLRSRWSYAQDPGPEHRTTEEWWAIRDNAREAFDRWHAAEIAAAEQRGAVKALREAATRLRDSKFANSVKPPHEKVQVPESDWLERRADRLEGDDE